MSQVCPKCNGKAVIKMSNGMSIACPICKGSGEMPRYSPPSNMQEKPLSIPLPEKCDKNIELTKTILELLVKYPKLFTDGIEISYESGNKELFSFLQNQNIFSIENNKTCAKITIEDNLIRELAFNVINFCKNK